MALLRVLTFDHEGRPVQFDTWLDDLQLYLLSNSKGSVSLFDLASGAAPAPPATADSATRSQWLTRDAAARLAIRNNLPLAKCAHFEQHRTAQALYTAVVARYSLPATAALGRLLLPYLFPELFAFATVEDLDSHLRNRLLRCGGSISEEAFVAVVITGLGLQWSSTREILRAHGRFSEANLCTEIHAEQQHMGLHEERHKKRASAPEFAFDTQWHYNNNNRQNELLEVRW
ncbi:unnamed protein product [Closterium sp. NIES-53]